MNNALMQFFKYFVGFAACCFCVFSCLCLADEPLPSTDASLTSPEVSLQLQAQTQLNENEAQLNKVETPTLNWSSRAQEVLLSALSLTGIRYKYGGNNPDTGFDCSGFVRYVFNQAVQLGLPRSALEMSLLGVKVTKNELQPGDLVFFNTMRKTFSHVGIYIGNNRFIHSPSQGGEVKVEDMQHIYWQKRFNGAKRIEESKLAN